MDGGGGRRWCGAAELRWCKYSSWLRVVCVDPRLKEEVEPVEEGFRSLRLASDSGSKLPVRLRRRPPRLLRTKTHSMPRYLQLEQVFGSWEACSPSAVEAEGGGSPSHLIFFSRHARQALLATGRFELNAPAGGSSFSEVCDVESEPAGGVNEDMEWDEKAVG